MIPESEIKAGQAVYTPLLLKIYDFVVLYINNYCIWRCPTSYQLEQYNLYTKSPHLDIGVGTGFFLKNARWPKNLQLSLMDLNPSCLKTAEKSARYLSPKSYLLDIFKRDPNLANKFDSISMNYLLHCLPGDMKLKNTVIENSVAMLRPQGILFGSTILSDPELQNFLSRPLMSFFNRKKIFANQCDRYLILKEILEQNLAEVEIKIIGCVALFRGIKK